MGLSVKHFIKNSVKNLVTIYIQTSFLTGCATFTSHSKQNHQTPERLIASQNKIHGRHIQNLRDKGIQMGMSVHEVFEIWGTPRVIEHAGEPTLGNSRWIYYNGLSSQWSVSPVRTVYFVSGHVTGWTTE